MTPRHYLTIALITLAVAAVVAFAVPGPTYTDAYYYFNAGKRLADGQGSAGDSRPRRVGPFGPSPHPGQEFPRNPLYCAAFAAAFRVRTLRFNISTPRANAIAK